MSSKQSRTHSVMIVFLAISLIGSGCATTSQNPQYKPHKPQLITGDEEREAAIKLPDSVAGVVTFLGWLAAGCPPTHW